MLYLCSFALFFLLCVLVTNISIDSYLCQGHACTHGDSNRGQGNVLKLAVNAAMFQICNSLFVDAQPNRRVCARRRLCAKISVIFTFICTILNKPTVASDAGTTRAPVTTDAATGMNAPNVAVGVAASLSDEVRMV